LGLSVLGRRDDGFHDIDTVMARLALCDELIIEPIPGGIELEVRGAALPGGIDNLAYRAAALYLAAADVPRGVRMVLDKRIPVAAGLGGGSADAAAVLRALAKLYPSGLELRHLAEELGSDVPFFLLDAGAARAQGRGERLTQLELPCLHLVLVNPGIEVKAGEAYAALQGFTPPLAVEALVSRLAAGTEPDYFNALQPSIVARYPAIGEGLRALATAGLKGVLMSGSGTTCFGLAASQAEAEAVAARLASVHPQWWVCATAHG
jgi:4-diphosphocytidyl-2-C-methyl-D-erythritol kinase